MLRKLLSISWLYLCTQALFAMEKIWHHGNPQEDDYEEYCHEHGNEKYVFCKLELKLVFLHADEKVLCLPEGLLWIKPQKPSAIEKIKEELRKEIEVLEAKEELEDLMDSEEPEIHFKTYKEYREQKKAQRLERYRKNKDKKNQLKFKKACIKKTPRFRY